jgi:hypothetical protein
MKYLSKFFFFLLVAPPITTGLPVTEGIRGSEEEFTLKENERLLTDDEHKQQSRSGKGKGTSKPPGPTPPPPTPEKGGPDPTPPPPCVTDVVVVGAGFSGLAAGKTLKDANLANFVILESTTRVGGRVKSKTGFGSGNITIEECANWVSPGTPIFDLIKKYSLNITRQDYFNYDVYEYNQSAVSLLCPGFPFTLLCLTLLVFLRVVGCRLIMIRTSRPHLSPSLLSIAVYKPSEGTLFVA